VVLHCPGRVLLPGLLDRGDEFLGREFDEYLAEHGIEHQLSVARSPQQNRRAERWQQTITQKAEAM
jgi:transposase InsO family protein